MANQLNQEPTDPATSHAEPRACVLSPERAFAELVLTGTFRGTFYASDEGLLEMARGLASAVSPELVAKTAIYCREHARSREVAAFLVAWLAKHNTPLMLRVFPRVIDDARMLRSFVAIVRSGVTGRRSFGSAPKRAIRDWFAARSPETIFRQSIGQSPSMSDVIKMVRPPPRNDKGEADAVREALYGYLIGKSVDDSKLPPLARAFSIWKKAALANSRVECEVPLPDVPLEMLTALPLRADHWAELAKKMSPRELRQSLHNLFRHGVFADPAMIDVVADRLADADGIKRSRTLPYQMLATYRAAPLVMPREIVSALVRGVDHALANVPEVTGAVALCPDVSGSMHAPLKDRRDAKVRCIDVAALVTAAYLRKRARAMVLPFSDDVITLPRALSPLDSVEEDAELFASCLGVHTTSSPAPQTACAAPLRWLPKRHGGRIARCRPAERV